MITAKDVAEYLVKGFCSVNREAHDALEKAGFRDYTNTLVPGSDRGFITIRLENGQMFDVLISEKKQVSS